jgi:hypothetical protein
MYATSTKMVWAVGRLPAGVCAVSLLVPAAALDNGVGITPAMGFNPWNCFGISSNGKCKLPLPWVEHGQPCHGFNETVILDGELSEYAAGYPGSI